MLIVKVTFKVKPEAIARFIEITDENVRNSKQESGIPLFEFLKDMDKKNVFYLLEAYNTPEAQVVHRETLHYIRWKSQVSDLLEYPYEICRMCRVLSDVANADC
ncbi:MAG: lsrG [Bacteroidetes bacterium]|nr:lsrG [Bacteroidota bacterium]